MEDSAAFASDTSGAGAGEAGAVLDFWRRFAMDDKKAELERSCVDMREMKTASISGRKRLNEITKAFRAKPKEEQLATVTEVLKAYQEEIDQLSRRSKFTESTFFGLYKALYEAPDPADCIQGLMEVVTSGSTHQLEIERLKAELAQYDEEFQKLKNQDITIRRLEDQLQEFRDQNEDKINEEVAKRMAQLEVQTEERVTEMRELQRAAEKRLGAALDSVKEAQQSADRAQSQLYELSARDEQRVSALRSENSLLAESCERLTIRLAEAERELSAARAVGGSLSRNASKGNVHEMDADHQEEALTLQMMVTELREEIRQKEDGFRTERQRLESSIRDSAQQLAREKEYAAKLKLELSERPTKMELMNIKKQLKTIQKIVFHVEDEDDDGANEEMNSLNRDPELSRGDGTDGIIGTTNAIQQLEVLLTNKLKSLESELTETRRELQNSRLQETNAKENASSLRKSLETSSALIARLEADLEVRQTEQLQQLYGNRPSDGSSAGDDLANLLGVTNAPAPVSVNKTKGKGGGSDPIHGQMVNILQAQRDRYKERLTVVETSMLKLQQQFEAMQLAKSQLEADNVALYGKIRYLQSYGGEQKSYISPKAMRISGKGMSSSVIGRQLFGSKGSRGLDESMLEDDEEGSWANDGTGLRARDVESRYHNIYEDRMNPFEEFAQFEKQRKLRELSVADRIVLNTTLAIVSNNFGRNAHSVHYGCDPSLDHIHGSSGGMVSGDAADHLVMKHAMAAQQHLQ